MSKMNFLPNICVFPREAVAEGPFYVSESVGICGKCGVWDTDLRPTRMIVHPIHES